MRRSCPIKKLDPDTCVDFSTKGTLVTEKFRKGWDILWGESHEKTITSRMVKKKKVNHG